MSRRRRRKHRSHVPFRILVWSGLAFAAVRWLLPPDLRPAPFRPARIDVVTRGIHVASNVNLRPVYRYSVIAGGAYSPAEVAYAESSDPVVRAHYADFHASRLRMIRTTAPRAGYVSYRVGNAVYWTRHKVSLPAGEVLITDGEHEARARCGNRVAATPQRPVNAAEPAPADLNSAEPVPPDVNLPGIKLAIDLFPALLGPPRPIPSPVRPVLPATLDGAPMWFLTSNLSAGLQPFSLFSPVPPAGGGSVAGGGGRILGSPLVPNPLLPYWPEPLPPGYYPSPTMNLPMLPVSGPVTGAVYWPEPLVVPTLETMPGVGSIAGAPVTLTTSDTPSAPSGVPEPASWALIAGAFGLFAACARRFQTSHTGGRRPPALRWRVDHDRVSFR